jgi:hypothetical protein
MFPVRSSRHGLSSLVVVLLVTVMGAAAASAAPAGPHAQALHRTAETSTSAALAPARVEKEASAAINATTATTAIAAPAAPAVPPAKPILGWSSWSMQSSKYPGLNPRGQFSWLSEANVRKQTDALAGTLKPYGYRYVNLDAGWWMSWSWQPSYDQWGRQVADPQRFPRGMKAMADYIHRKGLKAGIYLPVGLEKPAYGGGTVPIWNAAGCTTANIVYPDLRTTNGWDSAYKIDFGQPCAAKFVASQATLIAEWGFDYLKLDGVGPGSGKGGDNYDNAADVKAWRTAIDATKRPIHLELAWSLDVGRIGDWQAAADGWRIDTDVECYCRTLVTWDNSVDDRFADLPAWSPYAGVGGVNDLDSLLVGNGKMDGLTDDERRSAATLWAISASPLISGDDLTKLDKLGKSLLTNPEVLAVDQQGVTARTVSPNGDPQVWGLRNRDGSYTIALFNLGRTARTVTAYWSSFGFAGKAAVRDLWSRRAIGSLSGGVAAKLPAHGTRLFKVTPPAKSTAPVVYEAEAATNTFRDPAVPTGCGDCSGGQKVGNLYGPGALTVNGVKVAKAGIYQINVTYTLGDRRSTDVSANGGPATRIDYPVSGGWGTPATITVPVRLTAGVNTITFDAAGGYSPDIDKIAVPAKESGR